MTHFDIRHRTNSLKCQALKLISWFDPGDGNLTLARLSLRGGGGRLGGFIFVQPGGGAGFEAVEFVEGQPAGAGSSGGAVMLVAGRGLHSFAFQLNLGRFSHLTD
jgi:hypothetical protein